ncbi:uncharacterized protein K452DRAFT_282644 [Aplosporella prunicola CBS 121167]|uniref:Uncharacterized protein n=1 Tax=Aplosporella prunicola CBS 121167 TaxID=1176127 RepID=A0A6A6BQS6_9PEZI|nr:uncharacterized protein K452DRAFT_282644 [Aplosporella prunicola CBS 121167]KAF2146472.1 hypothetical protein K452DRAFT_282644 [Aplosporella prunicola CBS 121167]
MAEYYSQSTPDNWTHQYPCPMELDIDFLAGPGLNDSARLTIKRRKFGKFIGLRGCETPVKETQMRIELAQERLKLRMKELRDEEERMSHGFNKWTL